MTFASETAAISRTPISLVKITLDYCANTYGIAPCTATAASKCYNTYPTCLDKSNFNKTTKEYKFCSCDAPLSSDTARPYVKEIDYLPTEIKENDTVNGRVKIKFIDEPDTDVGIDPYLSTRSSVQGTFFKKFLARNTNYKGRSVKILEGYSSLSESDYQTRWEGVIDNIEKDKGEYTFEIVDLLALLKNTEIPAKLDLEVEAGIDSVATSVTITETSSLSSTGYVLINEEIIYYGAKDDVTNILSSLTRGMFGTTASTHNDGDSVSPVYYFSPANPYTHLQTMLTTAGIAAGSIDTTAFNYWDSYPHDDQNYSAIIIEPTGLDELFWDLVKMLNIYVWQNESQKITCRRNIASDPTISYTTVTDEANIIKDSTKVDLNTKSRLTRVTLYWNKTALGNVEDWDSYLTTEVAIDTSAESANDLNEIIEDVVYSRWIRRGYTEEVAMNKYAGVMARRRLMARNTPMEIIEFELELKDEGIKTGDIVKITTDEIQDKNGNDLTALFMITKREFKRSKVEYVAVRMPEKKVGFIAPSHFNSLAAVAASQTVSGAGNLTLTASPYVVPTTNRRLQITSNANDSGRTFTATYKTVSGGVNITSDATTGPNKDSITITKDGTPIQFYSVSQIAVSGACTGSIKAGIWLHYDDASESERNYCFISENNGYIDTTQTTLGYNIW